MNFNAVKALLAPMSDERFEEVLRAQVGERGHRIEGSVTLREVGLDAMAREVVAERDALSWTSGRLV